MHDIQSHYQLKILDRAIASIHAVTPPTSTTTQRPPVTVAATTPATPFSGSGAGNGDDDDIDSSGSGSGASDHDDWQLQQIQIIE